MSAEDKLAELGLTLPTVPKPIGNYVPFKRDGHVIYLSGQGPRKPDGSLHLGKVGRDVTVEQAYEHAKLVGLGLLAAAKMAAGSLDRVEVLKLLGMVNAVPEFTDQPKVINGCSDLLVAVLGERGRHALRRRARFAPERNDGRDRGRDAGRRVGNAYIRAKQRPSS